MQPSTTGWSTVQSAVAPRFGAARYLVGGGPGVARAAERRAARGRGTSRCGTPGHGPCGHCTRSMEITCDSGGRFEPGTEGVLRIGPREFRAGHPSPAEEPG